MKIGIALSGGGIRGIAHAGVLQALEDNGIKPNIIGGTSCGSMIAVLYAMGYSPYHIYILFKRYAKEILKIDNIPFLGGIKNCFAYSKVLSGLNTGSNIEELYNRIAKRRNITYISEIKMPLVIPSVDLKSGKEIIFTSNIPKNKTIEKEYITNITIGEAIRGSSSFPGFFSPFNCENYIFSDGGLLNNIPVDEVKKQGADFLIAVKFHADEVEYDSTIMDVVMKSIDIMGSKISENSLNMCDFILDVYTDKVGLFDVEKLEKCYEYGYECVKKHINKIKDNILNKSYKW